MEEAPQPISKKKKKKKSSLKKISEWSNLLRNFGSIIGAFISIITLLILLKQQERTYRPDLVFSAVHSFFSVDFKDNPRSCNDIQFSAPEDSSSGPFLLKMLANNIGLGAARHIKVNWTFDGHQLADTVHLRERSIITHSIYEEDQKRIIFENCLLQNQSEQEADFCQPVSIDKSSVQFALPGSYVFAWHNLLIRLGRDSSLSYEERNAAILEVAQTKQCLGAEVEYQDINEKQFKKEISIQIIPVFLDFYNKTLTNKCVIKEKKSKKGVESEYDMTLKYSKNEIYNVPLKQ